ADDRSASTACIDCRPRVAARHDHARDHHNDSRGCSRLSALRSSSPPRNAHRVGYAAAPGASMAAVAAPSQPLLAEDDLVASSAREKLLTAHVVIVRRDVRDAAAARLRELLERIGVGHIAVVDHDGRPDWHVHAAARPLMVSLSIGGDDRRAHAELDAWCAAAKLPWLRAIVDESRQYADV